MPFVLFVDRHAVAIEIHAAEEIKAIGEMEYRGTFAILGSVCIPRD